MKNGWQIMKLGEICGFEGGSQPPKSKFVYEEKPGYIRFLQIRDFGSDKNITFIPESKKNRQCIEQDILIGRYGASVGKVLTNKAGAYNVALMKTTPKLDVLNRSWFYNYLLSDEFQRRLLQVADRSAQAGFSKDDIYGFPVPVPPRREQGRIVGILDEAFEGIATAKANHEKNLQNASNLFENYRESVFSQRGKSWAEKPLGSIVAFRNGINFTKDSKGEHIKVVGVRNFQNNFFAPLDDLDTVTLDGKVSELDSLKRDDILAVRSNGNIELIGRCLLVGEVMGKISHSGFTIRIRLASAEALPRYLCHFLKSASSRKRLTEGGIGTNIKSLNQGMLSTLVVPLPPIATQKSIVEKLERLSEESQHLHSIYTSKLVALEALKKSLLHQAFTGKLEINHVRTLP
jgi:type I restriction enzyme, S subunit